MWSSVTHYDFRQIAGFVSDQVREQGKGIYFGVFYDPVPDMRVRWRWPDREDESLRQESRDLVDRSLKREGRDQQAQALDEAALKRALEILARLKEKRREANSEYVAESKRLLREQVKDFVEWLKGQGVI